MGNNVIEESRSKSKDYVLTAKQARVLPLLASGMTNAEAGRVANVNAGTISEWVNHDSEFQAALRGERQDVICETRDTIQQLSTQAIQQLYELMVSAGSEAVRLKAAVYVIERLGLLDDSDVRDDKKQLIEQLPQALEEIKHMQGSSWRGA